MRSESQGRVSSILSILRFLFLQRSKVPFSWSESQGRVSRAAETQGLVAVTARVRSGKHLAISLAINFTASPLRNTRAARARQATPRPAQGKQDTLAGRRSPAEAQRPELGEANRVAHGTLAGRPRRDGARARLATASAMLA
jgi:hypothetical protein